MTWKIWQGDCRDVMRLGIEDGSVHTCVTSPPYFGLRDYGVDGQIGLESTPTEYVEQMVAVFREVRRVLRDDGTLWLNLGDSYANDGKWGGSTGGKHVTALHGDTGAGRGKRTTGLKPKDLVGIPWRVAFALQADGWYLRQDIIWHKPNPMPESVRDRCTKAHEYIFLLSKGPRYYFDTEAMKEPARYLGPNGRQQSPYAQGFGRRTAEQEAERRERKRNARDSFKRSGSKREQAIPGQGVGAHREAREDSAYDLFTRNRRSVWTVPTRPYKGAHFATFPPALVEPCVRAGAPFGGLVLDPFAGSGTTGAVAVEWGRRFVGCELNPEYIKLAEARIAAAEAEVLW